MKNYKIIVPVTFREFDGGYDAGVQLAWLEELKKQSYQNFELIVTSFREKKVKQTLEESGINHTFYQSSKDCLFSMTEMFENCYPHVEPGNTIFFHCTADHILNHNFFEKLNKLFEPETGGTCYPHIQHPNIESYRSGRAWDEYKRKDVKGWWDYDPNMHIPECFYIDGDFLLRDSVRKRWSEFAIDGTFPGIGLSLYITAWLPELRNLVFFTSIHKIGNDTEIYQDSHGNTHDMEKNNKVLLSYVKQSGLPMTITKGSALLTRKMAMHYKYKPYGSLRQRLLFKLYFLYFFIFPRESFIGFRVLKAVFKKFSKDEAKDLSLR